MPSFMTSEESAHSTCLPSHEFHKVLTSRGMFLAYDHMLERPRDAFLARSLLEIFIPYHLLTVLVDFYEMGDQREGKGGQDCVSLGNQQICG